jgi:molybdopterin synthase catalytic subunit
MIRVQRDDFDVAAETRRLVGENTSIGSVVTFVGLVREGEGDQRISAMTLEHYPSMTEKMLRRIEAEAHQRWPLDASLIVHRVGRMVPGDRIVLVITASAHRQVAFEACEFLIDWLKTKAPFWKLEEGAGGTSEEKKWVEGRDSDDRAAARWSRG